MSKISPFAIHKTLIGIGGEPKSVKRLRSGDLLIETISDLQTKSFLLAKTFFNSPVTVSPHKTLNSCRGVISEPDLLSTPDAEILEGFSDQSVIQVRRITIKRDSNIIPTKHIILTFNKPKLPTTVKAGYLNLKSVLIYRTFCAVSNAREQKCVNCTQSHPSDSKLCQKWKIEKQIQELKTNINISYFEARRLIVPQLTQTYAQAARPSTISTASQTDPNLSNIICPPLQCLTPISSKNPLPGTSCSVSTFTTSSSSTQDNLLPSPSSILPTIQSESLLQIPIPTTTTTSPGNNLNTLVSPLETETRSRTPPAKLHLVSTENLHESVPNESNSEHSTAAETQKIIKRKSRNRRKRPKVQKPDIDIQRVPHKSRHATPTEITTDEEDMITYDVEEEELEQDPFILPKGYLRALTPSRYRNYRE
ncbi:RNA-directed DNA polymerase from mobile element jockey [Trichonephila clavipes]|uniref:RNA-directed DNA polymerase from mobile element jockey n=1 Tax=Trichonephila clavipes TaxID=2585209 RepID=A0A8X6UTV0_TRICX|nr:RNA-directed DNA polymerase from mobile element jockey [Trichonephila clavipes]